MAATALQRSPGRTSLLALCLGYFLDVTVVTVAIPPIGDDLRASLPVLQWVVDGYTLTFARSVFFLDVSFGVLGLVLTGRYVSAPAAGDRRAGLDVGARAIGALDLGGLLERRSRAPMVPLGLFRERGFFGPVVVGVLLNLGFCGLLFAVPRYFQRVHGLGALPAGLAMLPMLSSPLGGRLAARSGAWVPMAYGLVIGGAGLLGRLAPGTGTGYWALVAPLVLAGFGTGLTLPAATSAVMEAAPAALGGAASAVL
ncbi:MFS transporter, partial [Nonomuraea sp. NPDC049637]|uniref:MFS transporter n=1 Tax=Nonomuraea sp. NPDC049637 TaxID=3154356 RepID=UPI003438FBC9